MSTLQLESLLSRLDKLPRLPSTAIRLMEVVSDPDSSARQMADVIRFDPSLTAEILRLCNSSHFSPASEITAVDHAVTFLGADNLLKLVLTSHARPLLQSPQSGYGLPPDALWVHSVGVALASKRLADSRQVAEKNALFTAGLLHDIGKIVLNEYVNEEYATIVSIVENERVAFADAEQRVLGYTHAQVGGEIARRWGLPPLLRDCIRYHHAPGELDPTSIAVDIVHLADCVCLALGIGGGDDASMYRIDAAAARRLNLHTADLERVGAEAAAELRGVEQLFGSH